MNNGKREETAEHAATNKDVDKSNKKWGITQIAALLVALSTIGAVLTAFWSTAVQAGGKGTFATTEQVKAVTQQMEALDAGLQDQLKKMQADSDRKHQEYREDMKELNRSIQRLVETKAKGGK